jgi:hypothetical protein
MEPSMEDTANTTAATVGAAKRPYQKPAFRHEQVFETMALTCNKVPTRGCGSFRS